jgi:hypothetical protein
MIYNDPNRGWHSGCYMSDIPSGIDPLKEAVEQIKRDAYAAGWRAAMDAVSDAFENIPAPDGGDPSSPTFVQSSRQGSNSGSNPSGAATPTVGTTPHYVYQAVAARQGMTGAEVIAAVRTAGHDAAEPQIRTALSRLEKRQLLANRHRKWFLK